MDIKNSFEVPLPIDQAWKVLLDIERIAPCMPGAELLDVIDPNTYKGKVAVRLGPVALSFVGTAQIEEKDEAAHRARIKGKGADAKGRGGASGDVTFVLSSIATGTKVDVTTQVNLSGVVAQYGRGTGIIQEVATQIVSQFAASLRAMLERDRATQATASDASSGAAAPSAAATAPAKPISGFSLIARVACNYLRRMFGG